jgi:hypothetical protein
MDRDPARRFGTAREFREAVDAPAPGRYELGRRLREKDDPTHLGRDRWLDETVAIKVVPPTALDTVRAWARFRKPGVAPVRDLESSGSSLWLVTDFYPKGTLRDRMERGPLPREEAVRILAPVLDALALAHSHGLSHGNLKPENIALSESGEWVLLHGGLEASTPDADARAAVDIVLALIPDLATRLGSAPRWTIGALRDLICPAPRTEPDDLRRAADHLETAEQHQLADRTEEALRELEAARRCAGNEGSLAVRMARLYHRMARHGEALTILEAVASESIEGMKLRGLCLGALGRKDQAIPWLERVVEKDPESARLRRILNKWKRETQGG